MASKIVLLCNYRQTGPPSKFRSGQLSASPLSCFPSHVEYPQALAQVEGCVLDGLGLAAVVEGGVAVVEELLLPAVEEVGGDAEFIAKVKDGDFFQEMPFENVLRGKVTALLVHERPPYRFCEPEQWLLPVSAEAKQ